MGATLRVEPTEVLAGNCAIWEIFSDEPAADAWWEGLDNGVPINSQVAGWNDPHYWIGNYCYDPNDPRWATHPYPFVRRVALYDGAGNWIQTTNEVIFTVINREVAAGPGPSPQPPPGGSPPPGGGLPPIQPIQPPVTGIGPVDAILAQIAAAMNDIIEKINGIAGGIGGAIGERLSALLPSALDVLAGSNAALANFVATLGNALTPTTDFWGELLGAVGRASLESENPFWLAISSVLLPKLTAGLEALRPEDVFRVLDILHILGIASPDVTTPDGLIASIEGMPGIARGILTLAVAVVSLLPTLNAMATAQVILYGQASLVRELPTALTPEQATRLVVQSITDQDRAYQEARLAGLNEERFDLMVQAEGVPPAPETVLTMRNRGILDDEGALQAILESPLKLKYTENVLALRFGLATQGDLVRFLVREVFDSESRARLSLDADYPDAADAEFERIGVGPELARNYWAAHWDLPSPTQGFQMLHRSVIDTEELAGLLKAADYAPVWRDRLQAISYHPLTRVDIRRMHKVGVLSDDELVRAYQDIGYEAVNAERLRDFTIALNHGEAASAIEPFRGSLRGRIVTAYIDGLFSADTVTAALEGLLYTPEQIEAFITEADLLRAIDAATVATNGIKSKYLAGFVDEGQAAADLVGAGLPDDTAIRLVTAWLPAREYREETASERAAKDLTKAEILGALDERVIAENDARAMLGDLGYDAREVETLLALAAAKRQRQELNDVRETVHTLYVAGRIDRATAGSRLDGAGIPATNKDTLLVRWDAERERKVGTLPLATLKDLHAQSILGPAEIVQELRLHALNDSQIRALTTLWDTAGV